MLKPNIKSTPIASQITNCSMFLQHLANEGQKSYSLHLLSCLDSFAALRHLQNRVASCNNEQSCSHCGGISCGQIPTWFEKKVSVHFLSPYEGGHPRYPQVI